MYFTDFFSIQYFYVPFIILLLLLIHFRGKFYSIDNVFHRIDSLLPSKTDKIAIFIVSMSFTLILGFIISILVFSASDVDNAMAGAIQAFFFLGKNPYVYPVVPHIFVGPTQDTVVWGTYNYGPLDLIFYGIGYIIFSPFVGNSLWLYCTNVVIILLAYLVIRKIVPISDTIKILPFAFITCWFLQDNSVLMFFILSLAWYVHTKFESDKKYYLTVIILTLGIFTKLFIAFVLLGYFIYVLRENLKLFVTNMFVSLITAIIVLFPFGIINVVKSVFLFNVDVTIRGKYAIIQGGLPYYLDLLGLSYLFIPLAIICVIAFLLISEKYAKNQLNLKLAIFSILNLLLMPNSVYAFFIIPCFFLLIQYYQNNYTLNSTTSEKLLSTEEITDNPVV